jgi:hypothetical protein
MIKHTIKIILKVLYEQKKNLSFIIWDQFN